MKRLLILFVALLPILGASCAAATTASATTPAERLCADYLSRHITVDVLGDSIMSGTAASDEAHTAASRLDRILGAGSVHQRARAGSVTTDYLPGGQYYAQTQAVLTGSPTVVTMDWRLNEQNGWLAGDPRGASPDRLRTNLVTLINHIHQYSPSTTVLIVNPPIALNGMDVALQRQYIGWMWVAKEDTGSYWLDLALYFPDTVADNDLGLLSPDLLHPGNPGQAVMSTALHQRLHGTCAR